MYMCNLLESLTIHVIYGKIELPYKGQYVL